MASIIVLFGRPTDPQAFDEQYWRDHVPLAKKIPGLRRFRVHKAIGAPRGDPAYYQVVELEFESMDALKKALESPEARESGRHGVKLATGGITFLYTEPMDA